MDFHVSEKTCENSLAADFTGGAAAGAVGGAGAGTGAAGFTGALTLGGLPMVALRRQSTRRVVGGCWREEDTHRRSLRHESNSDNDRRKCQMIGKRQKKLSTTNGVTESLALTFLGRRGRVVASETTSATPSTVVKDKNIREYAPESYANSPYYVEGVFLPPHPPPKKKNLQGIL